jgi:hypothetical protein
MRPAGPVACASILLVSRLACAAADSVMTIATDRPAVTESSVVVPQGALQSENGMLVADSAGQYVLDLPESYVRYGLLEKTELRLGLPDYYHNLPVGNTTTSGFGDTSIGVKQQLGPVAGFDLSVIAYLSFPTGANRVSSHGYDPALQLPWSRTLSANWTLAGQLAAYWPTQEGRRNDTSEVTLLLDRQLSAPWDAFIEYAGDFAQRGGSSQLMHVGSAYKLTARQQIDVHAAVGLTEAAPRWFIGVGYSFVYLAR